MRQLYDWQPSASPTSPVARHPQMELRQVAIRPFLYFLLQNHFEQQIHVRHRLDRQRAGVAMDW